MTPLYFRQLDIFLKYTTRRLKSYKGFESDFKLVTTQMAPTVIYLITDDDGMELGKKLEGKVTLYVAGRDEGQELCFNTVLCRDYESTGFWDDL